MIAFKNGACSTTMHSVTQECPNFETLREKYHSAAKCILRHENFLLYSYIYLLICYIISLLQLYNTVTMYHNSPFGYVHIKNYNNFNIKNNCEPA